MAVLSEKNTKIAQKRRTLSLYLHDLLRLHLSVRRA